MTRLSMLAGLTLLTLVGRVPSAPAAGPGGPEDVAAERYAALVREYDAAADAHARVSRGTRA